MPLQNASTSARSLREPPRDAQLELCDHDRARADLRGRAAANLRGDLPLAPQCEADRIGVEHEAHSASEAIARLSKRRPLRGRRGTPDNFRATREMPRATRRPARRSRASPRVERALPTTPRRTAPPSEAGRPGCGRSERSSRAALARVATWVWVLPCVVVTRVATGTQAAATPSPAPPPPASRAQSAAARAACRAARSRRARRRPTPRSLRRRARNPPMTIPLLTELEQQMPRTP